MLARVSMIETFRRWRLDEGASAEDLVERLTNFQPTERMTVGTAFHKALELVEPGEYDQLTADGYTFLLPDADLVLPSIRELRAFKRYGDLTVTGKVDDLEGSRVDDHKTTESFKPDGYLEGCQWRFYLDLFGADAFRWNVFEIKADRKSPKVYHVGQPHTLEQYRYPGLHDDCMALANDYADFARRYMPDFTILEEAA